MLTNILKYHLTSVSLQIFHIDFLHILVLSFSGKKNG